MHSIYSLRRLSAKALSEKILEEQNAANPTFAIVDVRDDDYIGGHIKGSTNVPSVQIDAMMPTLVRKLKDKKTVRDGLLGQIVDGASEKEQEVYVLDKGFVGWQEVYGTDERLTEGYRKELWENY
ncbi:CDC25-like phosphatase YCH1 [Cladobotryum mycophilum]|uniref:CDC25-like phosphatase YCH1 n=1 Tax=Cladobotryum mycophilum TaxID=491253 RepID=A0ABR0SGN2_9HYPO